jgi:electron transport complex protein RnfG
MATPASESGVRRAARAALVLAVAATVAVGLVAVVHDAAQPSIEAARRDQQLARLTSVLGDLRYDNDPLTDTVILEDRELYGDAGPATVHRVRLGGRTVALLLQVPAPGGYSGTIALLVAVDPAGRLLGVRVTAHSETPGLGDFIEERRSDWIRRFDGRSLGEPPAERWQVRKDGGDFDQYTGATITSRAVVEAVRTALLFVERHRATLEAQPAGPGTSAGAGAPARMPP